MFQLNKVTLTYLLTLLFSPIISYYTFGIYNLPSSTYYFQIIAVFLAVLYYYADFLNRRFDRKFIFIFSYLIYTLIWSFYNTTFSNKGFANSELLTNLSIIAVLFIVQNTKYNPNFIKVSIILIKITTITAAIVSVIQVFNPSFFDATSLRLSANATMESLLSGEMSQDRRSSIFGFVDSNELGLSFLPLLSVLIGYLLFNGKKKQTYFYYGLGGIVALLSNGRYVIIGFIIISLLFLLQGGRKISSLLKYSILIIITTIFLFYLLELIGYDINEWLETRIFREGSVQGTTRWGAVENFLIFFPRTVFFGTGVHLTPELERAVAFVGSSQIHVGYLQHLVSYGILGSLFLFGFWFIIIKDLYYNAKLSNYWGAYIGFLIFLWANTTLVMYSIFYYGIIFVLVFDKYYKDMVIKSENCENEKIS